MSELFGVRQHSGPGTAFGPEAFRSMIGGTVPVTIGPDRTVDAVLKSAVVAQDGAYAELILEVPDGTLTPAALRAIGIGCG